MWKVLPYISKSGSKSGRRVRHTPTFPESANTPWQLTTFVIHIGILAIKQFFLEFSQNFRWYGGIYRDVIGTGGVGRMSEVMILYTLQSIHNMLITHQDYSNLKKTMENNKKVDLLSWISQFYHYIIYTIITSIYCTHQLYVLHNHNQK